MKALVILLIVLIIYWFLQYLKKGTGVENDFKDELRFDYKQKHEVRISDNSPSRLNMSDVSARNYKVHTRHSANTDLMKVGDVVNVWIGDKGIFVYPYGNKRIENESIGIFESNLVSKNYNSEKLRIKSSIISIENDFFTIDGNFHVIDKKKELKKHNDKFFDTITKLANKPLKACIFLEMPKNFRWNKKVYIKFSSNLDKIIEEANQNNNWETTKTAFWLIDSQGKRLSGYNTTNKKDTLNVIRNYKSGFECSLKYQKGQRNMNLGPGGLYSWECIY